MRPGHPRLWTRGCPQLRAPTHWRIETNTLNQETEMMFKLLVRFVNETGEWTPWDAMTEYEYDGGGEFPPINEDWPQKTLWIKINANKVQDLLNPPAIEAEIGPD